MAHEQTSIHCPDGTCTTHVFTPSAGVGPWPAVIVYMDALALRPALFDLGQRLADSGYVVLVPDLFYRFGRYEALDPVAVFQGDFRTVIGPMMATTDNHKAGQGDSGAFLAYLDTRRDVVGKVGTVGFCMGGGMAIAAAAYFPDRVAAAVSFHGGRLATDDATSPHLLAPQIAAELYIGVADNDASYPPEMAERFEQALKDAGVTYRSELYEGAAHGWMMPDFPIYDEAAAEWGWREMLALFDRTLHAGKPA